MSVIPLFKKKKMRKLKTEEIVNQKIKRLVTFKAFNLIHKKYMNTKENYKIDLSI